MNDTDNYTCVAADKYWQNAVKELDQFLYRQIHDKDKFTNFAVADRDQVEKLVGHINTIFMVLEEKASISTNWDQAATTYTFSFNELGEDNPIKTINLNENATMNR